MRAGNLRIHSLLAAIVEEGKAQGRIRPDVDADRVAWRVMGFYWFEDVSTIMDLGEVVSAGVSRDMFDDILADITAAPSASS